MAGFINQLVKPFIGHHDWNGGFYSQIARNYLNLGLVITKLGQFTGGGYYTHYPPLFPLTLALAFKLFGVSDLVARVVPAVFTLGYLILLVVIARKLKFSRLGSLAALAVAASPMVRYFSLMPSQEAMIVFFSFLSLNFYLDLGKQPNRPNLIKFLIATALNGLTGWAGYFLYPFIFLHAAIFKPRLKRAAALSLGVLVATFALHLIHVFWLTGSFTGGGLLEALLLRLNLTSTLDSVDPRSASFTLKGYLIQEVRWLTVYYTRILAAAGLIFLLAQLKNLKRLTALTPQASIILVLFLFGLAYPVIFSNVVYIHEYFNIFLLPFLALSFSWLVEWLKKKSFKLALVTLLTLIFVIAWERRQFVEALYATQAHRPGYDLGTLINQTAPEGQLVTVYASEEFIDLNGLFVSFYAGRQIKFIPSRSEPRFEYYD